MKPEIMVSIIKTGSKKAFEKMFFFGYKKRLNSLKVLVFISL